MRQFNLRNLFSDPLTIVILLGGLYRLTYLLHYYASPEWNQLLVDSLYHDRWAEAIASGDWVGAEAFFRAPLYIYFLGLIYAVFGHSILVARIAGCLFGLFSIGLTYKIAEKVFDKRTAVIAAGIHALYPLAVYYESELMVEPFLTFLLEAAVLTLLSAAQQPGYRRYAYSGLLMGLAAITKPVVLPLLIVIAGYIFLSSGGIKKAVGLFAVFMAGVILVILPVTIRNYAVSKDTVLVASSGGINFYIGNNSRADGLTASVPEIGANWQIEDIRYLAEEETGQSLAPSEISDYWYRKGWQWIVENPADFARLYIKKIYFFLNNYEVSNNRNLNAVFAANPILRISPLNFGMILAGTLLSLFFLRRLKGSRQDIILVLGMILLFAGITALYFINARFRLPILPFFFCLASFGAISLIDTIRMGRLLLSGLCLATAGAVYIFSISNLYQIDTENIKSAYFNQGNYFLYSGDFEQARENYYRLLAGDPEFPEANLNLGATFLRQGETDSAEFYFRKELAYYPANARALSNLATVFYLRKMIDSSLTYATRAIEAKPYFLDGYLAKTRALGAKGDMESLEELLKEAERNLPRRGRLYHDAGIIFGEKKEFGKAEHYLKRALAEEAAPVEMDDNAFLYSTEAYDAGQRRLKAKAFYELGYIYGVQNLLTESIEMSRQAIALDSNLAEAYINLTSGLLLSGQVPSAKATLETARRRFPENAAIKQIWESIK